jgi:tetratricopeptide (TPR) repeat protein
MDEWEDAADALKRAVMTHTDPLQRALADAALGRVLLDQGKEQAGKQALSRAMKMAHVDPHLEATIHQHRFEYASAILNLKSAQHHLQAQLRILQSCGDRAGHARCHIQLGVLDLISRSPESASSHLQAARLLCQTGGMPNLEAHALANSGVAARLSGDLAGAQDAFAEAAALASTQENHALAGYIYAHIGAAEASWDSIATAEEAFAEANRNLELSGDALMSTIQDALMGFVDLAHAREAALDANEERQTENIDSAMNRLARASSFETRSTPPRGREVPSRINEIRLARLLLDGALSALEPGH